jgi:hypothetical protein
MVHSQVGRRRGGRNTSHEVFTRFLRVIPVLASIIIIAIVIAAVTAEIPSGTYKMPQIAKSHFFAPRLAGLTARPEPGAMVHSEQQTSHKPATATGGFQKQQFTRVYKRLNPAKSVQDSAKNWEPRFPFQTSNRTP